MHKDGGVGGDRQRETEREREIEREGERERNTRCLKDKLAMTGCHDQFAELWIQSEEGVT